MISAWLGPISYWDLRCGPKIQLWAYSKQINLNRALWGLMQTPKENVPIQIAKLVQKEAQKKRHTAEYTRLV